MARLEIGPYAGAAKGITREVRVALSRRNILALLHKLDMPGSNRQIENNHVKIDGELSEDTILVLTCEDDFEHYANSERGLMMGHAGELHPDTEQFVTDNGGQAGMGPIVVLS